MDERRFDNLIRSAGAARSRRTMIGAMVATALGTGVARGASAQGVGAEAYDLTCRQDNAKFFCRAPAGQVTSCGKNSSSGCTCAQQKRGGAATCIEEPATGCPNKRSKCRRNGDCAFNEVCITVKDCCPDHAAWGKCVAKCRA